MAVPYLRESAPAHGEVEQTTPLVRRIVCNNPSAFTYRGTNTYIIGHGRVAVLDPGPVDPAQLDAILRATRGESISHIIISHTHRDHSPGAAALQAATGAPTYGFGRHLTPPDQGGEGGDHSFTPDVTVPDNGRIEGEGWALTALHTPGHCGNHLCFELEGSGTLFTADHVMSWSTSVVSPPDGDMTAYMRSLDRLRGREGKDDLFLPGHGPPLPEPARFVQKLWDHREERERRVIAALVKAGRATADELVGTVYGPLDPRLVKPAGRSLLSHLIKLEQEGAVARDGGENWMPL
jgi:glyoxylase-like metal-dependent hydrolase (beta-lactamase superfamily II)